VVVFAKAKWRLFLEGCECERNLRPIGVEVSTEEVYYSGYDNSMMLLIATLFNNEDN
jgi:hypothetical protein